MEGQDIKELLVNVGAGGGGAAAPAAGGAAAGGDADAAPAEEKEEGTFHPRHPTHPLTKSRILTRIVRLTAEEESDEDMGFGLFD